MPVVEKVKKPVVQEDIPAIAEDISIEKPRTRKPPTEAMKEAGRKNLEKGRLALQEKRKAAGSTEKPPTSLKVNIPPIQEIAQTVPSAPRTRSRKVIYQEETDSEDEVIIVKKKKKKPTKKIVYEESSEDEQPIIKKKTTPAVRDPSPPRYVQPAAVIRWI